MKDIKTAADGSARIKRLIRENAVFEKNGGFAKITLKDEDRTENRVFFHRNFPFEMQDSYISVLDGEQNEIGIIYALEDFDESTGKLIKDELSKRYYEPEIKKIRSVKERYGFSYWIVITAEGREVNFTVKDTFRSIIRVSEDKAIIFDVDGNRFVIESIAALDRKSYRKIEIYL